MTRLASRLTRIGIFALSAVAILATIAVIVVPIALSRFVRRNLTAVLQERFGSQVEIKSLQLVVIPHVYAAAGDIVLRYKGRTDVPPLMMIHKLTISASIKGLLQKTRHIDKVHIEGLQIHVPPKGDDADHNDKEPGKKFAPSVLIDEIVSDDALLETLPRDPKKNPRNWHIHTVVMHSFSFDHPAPFHAVLTNAVPVGLIDSEGQFGPWQADDPGDTPITANYVFSNADFDTLKGLAGTMSSTGKYSGTLDHLDVVGDTSMANFSLDVSGNPMPLSTHYVAVVDGTNGDTYLTSVQAQLGHSTISTSGKVVGVPGVKGRHILLDAVSHNARMEDFLRLVVKGDKPLMTGGVDLRSKIEIQPGDADLLQRLILNGQFGIAGARFTDQGTRTKLDSLSRRGRGRPKDMDIEDVASNLRGRFVVRGGKATFSSLSFDLPGARVELDGSYNLKSEELDFHGHLLLDAKLSRTTTGKKSVLLRLVDPFFKRAGGGSSIPIKVVGTRSQPDFGLDLHHHDDKQAPKTKLTRDADSGRYSSSLRK
jgi:hypothetical protein